MTETETLIELIYREFSGEPRDALIEELVKGCGGRIVPFSGRRLMLVALPATADMDYFLLEMAKLPLAIGAQPLNEAENSMYELGRRTGLAKAVHPSLN
jgi:hypothetical protein